MYSKSTLKELYTMIKFTLELQRWFNCKTSTFGIQHIDQKRKKNSLEKIMAKF